MSAPGRATFQTATELAQVEAQSDPEEQKDDAYFRELLGNRSIGHIAGEKGPTRTPARIADDRDSDPVGEEAQHQLSCQAAGKGHEDAEVEPHRHLSAT